jgi:superfamily II DNA or RNA helicase
MQELFDAVRAASPPGLWSKAVELVRHFAVTQQSAGAGDLVCRVRVTDQVIPATVHLYLEDAEWDCDCPSKAPCCEHVAAAVIAARKAKAEGKALPEVMSSVANLGYRFSRYQNELRLEPILVRSDGTKVPLKVSLSSIVSQHGSGIDLTPTQEDLKVDRLIGPHGALRSDQILTVLKLLAGHANLEFEGSPIAIATEPLRPRASISYAGADFLVQMQPDPAVREIVASFVALTDQGLAPLGATDYCGARYEKLIPEKRYAAEEVATLVTELLPELRRWFVLDIQTARLPETTDEERPRVVIDVRQQGDQLNALATLVYGDPPLARIDKNRMVHIDGPVPIRKVDLERRAAQQLRQSLGLTVGVRSIVTGKDAIQLAKGLDHWNGEIAGSETERWVDDVTLRPRLSRGDLLPRFYAKVPNGKEHVAAAPAVVKAYREGMSLVPLLDGGFAKLPMDWLSQHVGLLEKLLSASGEPKARYLAPTIARLHEALGAALAPDLAKVRQLLLGLECLPQATLPDDMSITLRPYQQQGINWLSLMRQLGLGAILADDMGLGKTIQVLAIVEPRTLIVCPTSLISNWIAELRRFRPGLSVRVYHGQDRALVDDAAVTLTSYAILRRDADLLAEKEWSTVVLDEAQAIKNADSQVAQATSALRAQFRVSLTGTPIENRLEDLWSQLNFTNPGLLGSREEFERCYVEPIRAGQSEAAAQLRSEISPFLLRRTKSMVLLDLPPKHERILYVDLEPAEREIYAALAQLAQTEIVGQLRAGKPVLPALEALLRLRQAACHTGLLPGYDVERSSKLELLVSRLESAILDGHKSLVFSQWTTLLDKLEPELKAVGIGYLRLDGSTVDRGKVVEQFQRDDGPKVMLLSIKAGGTGLNLTAADHVFLVDLWWNPAVEQQAADRTHRIGQTNPVFIHRLISKGTVEERILSLHERKREISAIALEDSDQAAQLTRDDLIDLLS